MTISGEFTRIDRWLRPLADGFAGAAGLKDDAAFLTPPAGCDLVITTDTMVAGVHYTGREAPQDLAAKLVRVNLSDLAGKLARPFGYTLNLALGEGEDDAWFEAFCQGLAAEQDRYGITLMGGDSVRTPGPAVLTLTGFGTVPAGQGPRRGDARAGDAVLVTGTIGDAAIGLLAVQDPMFMTGLPGRETLVAAYYRPDPPVAFAPELLGLVHASMDISDGLAADLAHICEASGLGARLHAPRVPVSDAAAAAIADHPDLFAQALGGGDDYQLLLTAAPDAVPQIEHAAATAGLRITVIGEMTDGQDGVAILDQDGRPLTLASAGYTHF